MGVAIENGWIWKGKKELVILLNYCTFQDLHKTGSDLYMYNCSLNMLQIVDQAKSPISTSTSNTSFSVIVWTPDLQQSIVCKLRLNPDTSSVDLVKKGSSPSSAVLITFAGL